MKRMIDAARAVYRKSGAKEAMQRLDLTRLRLLSYYKSVRDNSAFRDVETYCMFIGYPRSGHSLIGSLLDAHPNMVIAHELDALKYIQAGFSKYQVFHLLLDRSRAFSEAGRRWTGYSYAVPDQWQGRYQKLQVIGDKKGGRSSMRFRSSPELLQLLRDTVDLNIKFIHITRNPYDNISTMLRRQQRPTLRENIELYFSMCETVLEIKDQIESSDFLDMKLEDFIACPESSLSELCHFLGVETSDAYLKACAGIVAESPHRTRYDISWDGKAINLIADRLGQVPFLDGYSFHDG
jgi:hypothetical protein